MSGLQVTTDDVGVEEGDPVRVTPSPVPPGLGALDEAIGEVSQREFQPRLEAAETDTSSSTLEELVRYTAPPGRIGLLDEVAVNVDSNGAVVLSMQGSDPVTYSGAIDASAAFDGAYLYPGQRVRVLHKLDGTGTATNRASISVREV